MSRAQRLALIEPPSYDTPSLRRQCQLLGISRSSLYYQRRELLAEDLMLRLKASGGSMSRQRYTEEFMIEAVKQVTERGHPVAEVAARLGVSGYSLSQWIKRYAKPAEHRQPDADLHAENRRLKAELKRVSEELYILKKATVGMPPRTSPESPTEVRVYP